MGKFRLVVILLALAIHTLSYPLHLSASGSDQKVESKTDSIIGKIVVDEDKEIPLYEDAGQIKDAMEEKDGKVSKTGNILGFLKNDDEVEVIEVFESYSLIKFIQKDDEFDRKPNTWIGYIENQYLQIEPDIVKKETGLEDIEEDDIAQEETGSENIKNDDIVQEETGSEKTKDADSDVDDPNTASEIKNSPDEEKRPSKKVSSKSIQHYRGIALKEKTYIRTEDSTTSKPLHIVPIGTILEYTDYRQHWYKVTVHINGVEKTGFIHENHVENAVSNQEELRGVTLNSPTNVRDGASTKARVAKKYPIGSIINYKTFSTYWYEVFENGKSIGFVHKKHVENATVKHESLRGVTLKSPTNIRTTPSTQSDVLTTFPRGSVIKYNTFNDYWYEVKVDGTKSGFIHKNHVENTVSDREIQFGIALKSPTNVRAKASTAAKVITSFPADTIIEYKTFSAYWYEVSVEVDGKKTTGYIHKNHLGDTNSKTIRGVTLKEPTNIRTAPSTQSDVLTTFPKDTILEYKFHNKYWYEITVNINGKPQTGYIHDNHIGNVKTKTYRGVALNNTTYIRTEPSTKSSALVTYPIGTIIEYHLYNDHWYEVIVDGSKKTGYIHKNHIEEAITDQENLEGFALKSPTNIRSRASTNSDVVYKYTQGSIIRYKTFSTYWHEVTFTVNGVQRTGYIHRNHVGTKNEIHKQTKYDYDFKHMVDKQMAGTPKKDGAGTTAATRGLVEFYTNPLNFPLGTTEYYQFLVLSQPAGLDAKQINEKILKGKGHLEGQAQAFINAGKKYGINEAYLIGHALHETGNGSSTLANGVPVDSKGNVTRDSKGNIAKTSDTAHIVYNMYGYGAIDSCPIECGAKKAFDEKWFTPEDAIIYAVQGIYSYISRGQDTLYKMKWNPIDPGYPQYATHVQWATLQTKYISSIYSLLDITNLTYDIPAFNNQPDYEKEIFGITQAVSLNLRNVTNTNDSSSIIGSIPFGSTIQIIGSNPNGWYNVNYNGTIGWVSAEYVHLIY